MQHIEFSIIKICLPIGECITFLPELTISLLYLLN